MSIYYQDDHVTLHHGDCLEVLATLPDASVDSVVTDPPYGLANTSPEQVADTIVRWVNGDRDYLPGGSGFMGKAWDAFVPPVAVWDECLRVLKPGGHLLAFAGSRTHDLMALGIRLAGFEIRDSIAWLYGSGFPKSLDVSKAIDKSAGAEREIVGLSEHAANRTADMGYHGNAADEGPRLITAPATPDAEKWHGWGTALKPAFEPIVVARKPLAGTVAQAVLQHGTGALNIDGCRVATDEDRSRPPGRVSGATWDPSSRTDMSESHTGGRWPTNVLLDDSQAAELDRQSGVSSSNVRPPTGRDTRGIPNTSSQMVMRVNDTTERGHVDSGGASRFFPTFRYEAKAPTSERPRVDGIAHPTVKPLDLMRWLVRLVTPPGGTVLEPFAGSGTTAEACVLEGFQCIAIEREPDYLPLIVSRLSKPMQLGLDFGGAA